MKTNWNEEKNTIEQLIKEGVPYEKIGRKYEVTGACIKKVARKLGIKLEPKRKINPKETFGRGSGKKRFCINCGKELGDSHKFCSHACQHDYQYKEYIKSWKEGNENGISGMYGVSEHIRKYLFEKYNCKCQECGWGERNEHSGTVPLQIHHIDGDYRNNKEENLQLLCPNCHSLTETFGRLNKNGRKERKKYR